MTLITSTAYIGVSILTIIAVGISAAAFFRPSEAILESMAEGDVKESWLPILGALKAAGAFGLLIGIGGQCQRSGRLPQSASLYTLSVPPSSTCALATTRSVGSMYSSCWPWPYWYWT